MFRFIRYMPFILFLCPSGLLIGVLPMVNRFPMIGRDYKQVPICLRDRGKVNYIIARARAPPTRSIFATEKVFKPTWSYRVGFIPSEPEQEGCKRFA